MTKAKSLFIKNNKKLINWIGEIIDYGYHHSYNLNSINNKQIINLIDKVSIIIDDIEDSLTDNEIKQMEKLGLCFCFDWWHVYDICRDYYICAKLFDIEDLLQLWKL